MDAGLNEEVKISYTEPSDFVLPEQEEFSAEVCKEINAELVASMPPEEVIVENETALFGELEEEINITGIGALVVPLVAKNEVIVRMEAYSNGEWEEIQDILNV